MIPWLLLLFTLLSAIWCLLVLWRAGRTRSGGLLALGLSLCACLYLYGAWVFLSIYLKYVFVLLAVVALVVSVRQRSTPAAKPLWRRAVLTLGVATFLLLNVLYFTGTSGKPYGTIRLQPPFRHGSYFVFQGGRGLPTNLFHFFGRRTLYAIDLIKLNNTGGRAKHVFSKYPDDYCIFGDTIYSPCSGTIAMATDDNPDNIPPTRKRGPHNLNGVLLETDSAWIFMGHMKMHNVFVHEGDKVITGQPLGLAGNSGMSIEPHLHIQAHAKTFTGKPFYREPQLLILFRGKEYRLFERINAN